MAEKKYADLVKKLVFRKGMGGANARELVFVQGNEMAGFELNFIIGVYDQPGDWAPGRGAHSHVFDECLLFFGYDDKDLGYMGSDMSLAMGKELEAHKFSVPTVVAAPGGMPHCPLVTEKVYKPFGHFHLALSAKYSGESVQTEGTTDGDKYTHLFRTMKVRKGPGGADAVQLMSVAGDELAGFALNFKMGLYNATGQWETGGGALVHPYDSIIVFFGHKTDDLSYLGAEISIDIGKERERYTIDAPTVVSIPKGTPYGPVMCNRVERPYGVMRVGLAPRYESSPAS